MTRPIWTLLLCTLLAACAQRTPTLPDVPAEQRAERIETPDWEGWGPEENAKIPGTRLTTEAIASALQGRVLRGCYPSGEKFAELLADDGRFYDALKDNTYLGDYAIRNDQLCFAYPNGQTSCFAVVRNGAQYDFYSASSQTLAASTACPSNQG